MTPASILDPDAILAPVTPPAATRQASTSLGDRAEEIIIATIIVMPRGRRRR